MNNKYFFAYKVHNNYFLILLAKIKKYFNK